MVLSVSHIYFLISFTASVVFVGLSLWGGPPPITREINLPHQAIYDEMHMDNRSYTSWNEESDRLWDALLPENGGSVLATNLTSGYHFWGRIAMFHQLQCLRDIRKQLAAMSESWDASRTLMSHNGWGSEYERFGYCFDYVRQGILCHADTTLQPVAFNSEWADGKVVDGNALWHTCKDRKVLYEWATMSGWPHQVYQFLMKENVVY
jgi:hypothetical protein